MRFKTGFIVGVGVGYVLGARAGRERYEQIVAAAKRAMEHDTVAQYADKGKAVYEQSSEKARAVASDGIAQASQYIRERSEPGGQPSGNGETPS